MRCQWGSETIAQAVVILTLGCRPSVESADSAPVRAVNFGRGVVAGSLHPLGPRAGLQQLFRWAWWACQLRRQHSTGSGAVQRAVTVQGSGV
ncbi:hypothetical protein VFPFJ_07804 [Purpureocillium lilacinum]|uniref:Secreted protein n=1 Tax=Purpureocillium lilacinum TaxID=33203 RepID=A0A179H5F9_PURLI|nr:hypothetical protein VFPFJ_07804 [Purpureocillium lilacinum]OAQ85415.1 hypothetical protein VFPFJ_07804 [Purpureocillium lilacinum]